MSRMSYDRSMPFLSTGQCHSNLSISPKCMDHKNGSAAPPIWHIQIFSNRRNSNVKRYQKQNKVCKEWCTSRMSLDKTYPAHQVNHGGKPFRTLTIFAVAAAFHTHLIIWLQIIFYVNPFYWACFTLRSVDLQQLRNSLSININSFVPSFKFLSSWSHVVKMHCVALMIM